MAKEIKLAHEFEAFHRLSSEMHEGDVFTLHPGGTVYVQLAGNMVLDMSDWTPVDFSELHDGDPTVLWHGVLKFKG